MSVDPGTDGDNTLRARDTSDEYDAGGGGDVVSGGAGDDTIYAGTGDDAAEGQSGNDIMYGGSGNDVLFGGSGDDVMYGGGGIDWLNGGAGKDDLIGGPGLDIFVFSNQGDADGDVIWDFQPFRDGGEDVINLSSIDAIVDKVRDGNQDFTWIGQAAFDAPGQLRYYWANDNTYIAGNTDGASGAEFTIILDGVREISHWDFAGLV